MTHGSLFSGIGGIDLGFEMAGIKTSWTCEVDEWCNEILKKRFPNATQYKDIKDVGKHNLQPVDIISGGFPCQDISTAGKGKGLKGERSGLWFEMWRVISELRPRWVLIENVPNLANKGGARVLHDLAKAGYDAEWQIISARDVGARHLRKRIWIVAYPKELSDPISKRLYRHLHSVESEDRNTTRREWTDESSIQRRDTKLSNSENISRWNRLQETCGTKGEKSKLLQGKDATSTTKIKDGLIRGGVELSDSSSKGFQGQSHKSTKQGGNEMGRRQSSKKNIQRRDTKLSDTKSSRYRGGSSKECGDKRKGKFQQEEQKGSSIWSEAERCDNIPAQTTSKRGADKNIKKKNKRLGEFKIKTFEILKNEPGLDRVAYGLSNKVDRYKDRVKGLGNSVVPQIPYLIGRRLKEIFDYEQS